MKRRWVDWTCLLLLAAVAGTGCGEECPRRLKTEVRYTGVQAGVVFARQSIQGTVTGLSGGRIDANRPAGRPDATSDGCWSEPASADTPGYLLEAWLDIDGDDQSCRDLASAATCGPDPGEPQARMEFVVKATGTTDVELSFGDP